MKNNFLKNIQLKINNISRNKTIPIFFATDDNYIPYLEVALRSLVENASKAYTYNIHILNTGLKEENKDAILKLANKNFNILFEDISYCIEPIKAMLKDVYHFSVVMYYRLFIEKLFPQYDKVIYLDCDIVVLGDISKLYNVNLGGNLIGACQEQVINSNETFRKYANLGIGVPCEKYFNSGILLMNLKKFRQEKLCEQFVYLINTYNFDVVDPDQAYLNVLCYNKVKYLPNGWNKEALPIKLEGKLNIVHYALYKKPWQYDDIINVEYFWHYAKKCTMYNKIVENKASFDDNKKKAKEQANIEIVEHSLKIIDADNNMKKVLFDEENFFERVLLQLDAIHFELPNKVNA